MLDLSKLHEAVRYEGGVSRRLFLAYAASLSAIPLLGRQCDAPPTARVSFAADPFSVGVASAIRPRAASCCGRDSPPAAGTGRRHAAGRYRSRLGDRRRRSDAQRRAPRHGGRHAAARPLGARRSRWPRARSLVLVPLPRRRRGEPDRPHAHDAGRRCDVRPSCDSPSPRASITKPGCTRPTSTWPRTSSTWCSTWATTSTSTRAKDGRVRKHVGKEIQSLDDYRIRHAQYKSDPLLAGDARPLPVDGRVGRPRIRQQLRRTTSPKRRASIRSNFLSRRANAYQAYYEMMPLRHTSLPQRAAHAALSQGVVRPAGRIPGARHAQYRTDQPNGDEVFDVERRGTSPERHDARAASKWTGCRSRSPNRPPSGTSWPSK